LFHLHALLAADRFHVRKAVFDGRLHEEGAGFEFAKNAATLVFLLETTKCAVDRLVSLNGYSNHDASFDEMN